MKINYYLKKMPNQEIERAKDLLSKIYIDLKINNKDNKDYAPDKLEKEIQYLKNLSIIDLINVLSNYFNILLEIKNSNKDTIYIEEDDEKPLYKQYEELLIKAENDIRKHIKVNIYIFIIIIL